MGAAVTSARILIHPRCTSGPASAALAAHLQANGFDITKVICGPEVRRGFCDLVRVIREEGTEFEFERMDGSRFEHSTAAVRA
jgi:hypothetical protein